MGGGYNRDPEEMGAKQQNMAVAERNDEDDWYNARSLSLCDHGERSSGARTELDGRARRRGDGGGGYCGRGGGGCGVGGGGRRLQLLRPVPNKTETERL